MPRALYPSYKVSHIYIFCLSLFTETACCTRSALAEASRRVCFGCWLERVRRARAADHGGAERSAARRGGAPPGRARPWVGYRRCGSLRPSRLGVLVCCSFEAAWVCGAAGEREALAARGGRAEGGEHVHPGSCWRLTVPWALVRRHGSGAASRSRSSSGRSGRRRTRRWGWSGSGGRGPSSPRTGSGGSRSPSRGGTLVCLGVECCERDRE